jgi:hypothetical protein
MTAKDVGVRIRVERELRDAFQQACAAENRQASDLIRDFMRSYSEQRGNGLQYGLFAATEPAAPYAVERVRRSPSRSKGAK